MNKEKALECVYIDPFTLYAADKNLENYEEKGGNTQIYLDDSPYINFCDGKDAIVRYAAVCRRRGKVKYCIFDGRIQVSTFKPGLKVLAVTDIDEPCIYVYEDGHLLFYPEEDVTLMEYFDFMTIYACTDSYSVVLNSSISPYGKPKCTTEIMKYEDALLHEQIINNLISVAMLPEYPYKHDKIVEIASTLI